ncbi:MAG TPA: ABC transporter ATP-binding protein [Candidatus Saccharimonadales bacterium]
MKNTVKQKQLARQTLKMYWQHAWRHKGYVISLGFAMPLASLIFRFLPPLIVATILQRLSNGDFTKGDLWASFGPMLMLYAGLVILGGVILWRVIIILIWKLEMLVLRDMHQRIFAHLMNLSATFHANRFGGSLVSQANKFGGSYIRVADTTVFNMTTLLLSFIFASIILAPKAPIIVAVLLGASVIFMVSAVFITRRVRELNAVEATVSNRQTGYLADAISNVLAVKSFAGQKFENKRFAKATENTRKATNDVMWAGAKRDALFGSMTTGLDVTALTLAVASVVVFDANISTVFLVITYTGRIGEQLWEFCQSTLRNYNRAIGDARDMTEILMIEPGVKDPAKPEKSRIKQGAISFRNMTFTHPESNDEDTLFQNLSLEIKPGEKIGLIGRSGSGKTSLTKLLLRYTDIDSGEILIDGQNIASISQDDLRRSIAYVPQEPLLFHRSIRENIAYGKPSASLKEVREAALKAHAADFIEKLPQGYETLVGERGVKLSGGQRQRIAIARAILKDAPILVLDEATSALDSESEQLIQSALWELMKDRTAIAIAHRLSTIQKMDRILVLDNGAIIEQGTHAELVQGGGIYAQLWAHQSGGFIEE